MGHTKILMYLFLHIWTTYWTFSPCTANKTITDNFIRRPCYDADVLVCRPQLGQSYNSSKLRCAWECNRDSNCTGFVFYADKACMRLHGNCFQNGCASENNSLIYEKEKDTGNGAGFPKCLNGGVWDPNGYCICSGGWIGGQCEDRANDCTQLVRNPNNGYALYKEHTVLIDVYRDGSLLPQVTCYCMSSFCKSYIFQNFGSGSNVRDWLEYVEGYSELGNVWLGLKNIYAFNSMLWDRVEIEGNLKSSSDFYMWTCRLKNFRITSASLGYQFTGTDDACMENGTVFWTQSTGGTFTNILTEGQNVNFSTYDNDQDLDTSISCANVNGAGWWFTTCPNGVAPINPLGAAPNRTDKTEKEKLRYPNFDFSSAELQDSFYSLTMYFRQDRIV